MYALILTILLNASPPAEVPPGYYVLCDEDPAGVCCLFEESRPDNSQEPLMCWQTTETD